MHASAVGMSMTIKVYEVDRYGCTRVVKPTAEVTPADSIPASHALPPCQCTQCTGSQQ
ncbi:hypothetical protein ACFCV8_01095 [Streptomyces sp. NPDC056347]|uniref:hypothetical protein n=1 Tax=Streptomyces sp. NPDC056347 TaxID=3345790 RepID=UPI0035E13540